MPLIIIKLGQIRDVFQASKHGYRVARDNHPGERHMIAICYPRQCQIH